MVDSATADRALCIVALIDRPGPQAWARRVLEAALADDSMDIVALLLDDRQPSGRMQNPVLSAYRLIDRAFFGRRSGVKDATAASPIPPGAPAAIPLSAWARTADSEGFSADVALHLASGAPPLEIAARTRLGLWYVEHGSAEDGEIWGAAEVAGGRPTIESRAMAVGPNDTAPRVLATAVGPVRRYSLARTRNPAFWRGSAILGKALRQAARGDVDQPAPLPREARQKVRTARVPLRAAGDVLCRIARRSIYREDWLVGIRPIQGEAPPGPDTASTPFREVPAPPGCYFADPFPFSRGESEHLFLEEFDRKEGRGRIVHLDIAADLSAANRTVVLDRSYHLSFPFVFEWQGEVFMVPETSRNRTIDLYRAHDFPNGWEFDRTLMRDIAAVDTVIHEHEGTWWLFTSIAGGGDSGESMSAFSAESPLGPWQPHPGNPVVCDVRCARAAGRPIRIDGQLIRPTQDGSERYGGRIRLRAIDALTRDAYEESNAGAIEPRWRPGLLGTHTWNRSRRIEAVDGDIRRSRLSLGR